MEDSDRHMKEDSDRRGFLARGLELISTIPLACVLANNFFRSRQYYETDTSQSQLNGQKDVVSRFHNAQLDYSSSLDQLVREYSRAYHHSHTRMVPRMDSKGNMSMHTETYWEWEEPRNVPKHDVVKSWEEGQARLLQKTYGIVSKPLIDISKIKKIVIEEKQTNALGQGALNLVLYGSEIGLLLGYEELIAKATDNQAFSRRSFFRSLTKISAAFAGAFTASSLGEYNDERLRKGKATLKDEIDDSALLGKVPDAQAFQRYFETTPDDLITRVKENIRVSKDTLKTRVENAVVRNTFESVVRTGEDYISGLEKIFVDGVPKELGFVSSCALATKKIEDASANQKTSANVRLLVEGAAVGGVLAGVLAVGEGIKSYKGY